jgi:uncharacterized protein
MDALIYFVKYPEPGKVKTRLAKHIGANEAARVYRRLVEINFRILSVLPRSSVQIIIAFDPIERVSEFRSWLSGPYEYAPQEGNDLGERLWNAFQFAFGAGFKSVMALGSDTLGLDSELILKGFEALEFYDITIGPAYDGGYYLIGMGAEHPSIFNNIPWSSPRVLEATLEKLNESQQSYYLLKKLDDLDEAKNIKGGKTHEILT